jgi:hypothetical protein
MAKLPLRAFVIVVLAAAVYFGAVQLFRPWPPGANDHPCEFREIATEPQWLSSAVWAADGRELLVLDPVYRRILRFSDTGRLLGTVQGIDSALANIPPYFMKTSPAGLLIELEDERMVALDWTYTPRPRIDLRERVADDGRRIESVFLWTQVGEDLVALSDLYRAKDDSWSSSFVRVPLFARKNIASLFEVSSEARKFYRLGHPYLTTLGDTAYLLSMGDTASLVRIPAKGENTQVLTVPVPGRQLPALPQFRTYADVPPLMEAIERSTMPVGLYGWEGFLYVLSRAPSARGTLWTLTKIDPRLDRIVANSRLPTSANHLTVVPGAKKWALVEKGPVVSWGHQETRRVLLVPASQIRKSVRNLCE